MVLQGILAAARKKDCNILISGGLDTSDTQGKYAPSWPKHSRDTFFVPVGPWNTDGLIIIPPLISAERSGYLQSLRQDGFPVLFAGPGEIGATVMTDNIGAIEQAIQHLWKHGHRQIAFIAGLKNVLGDSSQRLEGYRKAIRELSGSVDERLIVFGQHNLEGGKRAAMELLAGSVPFTAAVTSNFSSAIGALQCMKEFGKQVPEEIALIAIDENLDAEAQNPPLSTIHLNTFELGVQAFEQLLRLIDSEDNSAQNFTLPAISIPSKLIKRRSCGCETAKALFDFPFELLTKEPIDHNLHESAQNFADPILYKPEHLNRSLSVPKISKLILQPLFKKLFETDAIPEQNSFIKQLETILDDYEALNGDPVALQNLIVSLRFRLFNPIPNIPPDYPSNSAALDRQQIEINLQDVLLLINERIRRQSARIKVREAYLDDQLGSMTAELLTSLQEEDILKALASHLSDIGIQWAWLAIYENVDGDPFASTQIWQKAQSGEGFTSTQFPTCTFPLPELLSNFSTYQMVLVPLVYQDNQVGYVAFDASNLVPCGAIARQVAASMRTCSLFRQATHGRRMAEEADQMKSRFLSTVSHELRTPLNMIIGFSELILESHGSYGADLPPALLADINAIQRNSQHLSRLIDDVLSLNQIEAGKMSLARDWKTISSIADEAVTAVQAMFKSKHLTLETDFQPDLPPVFCDDTRVRQVFLNLLSNAGRFTEHGGVKIVITRVEMEILVQIKDTGPGIDQADLGKIFEPFRQLDSSLTRRHGGTGLGLSISKNFIEMHGGRIWVESRLGSGTTFFFTLPVSAPFIEKNSNLAPRNRMNYPLFTKPAEIQPVPNRFVILEEGHILGQLINRIGDGIEIVQTRNTETAIAELQNRPARALIITQSLFNKNRNLSEQLAAVPKNIPIIICPIPEQQAAPDELGIVNYLLNPITKTELLHKIDELGDIKTILLVDDHPEVLQLISRILTSRAHPYRVFQTTSALRALQILHKRLPDLILLNLTMPDIDAKEFLTQKKQDETLRSIPVIGITSSSNPEGFNLIDALTVTSSRGLDENDLINFVKKLGAPLDLSNQSADLVDRANPGAKLVF